MSNARTARLAVAVSEISLTASYGISDTGGNREPLTLLFSGTIKATAADFQGSAWDLPARLERRDISVRCVSTPRQSKSTPQESTIGRCQFCPIARQLDVAVEVNCCPKLFHVLKNTAGFGGNQGRAGLTLMLDVMEDQDTDADRNPAIVRLAVTRLAVTAARTFGGPDAPWSDAEFSATRSSVPSSGPVL